MSYCILVMMEGGRRVRWPTWYLDNSVLQTPVSSIIATRKGTITWFAMITGELFLESSRWVRCPICILIYDGRESVREWSCALVIS